MGVLWRRVEPSGTPFGNGAATGGAIPCVVGNRIYLIGGSTTSKDGPDIALGAYTWSPSFGPQHETASEEQPNEATTPPIAEGGNTAAAAAVLTNCKVSQAGDVPTARIGHAAVVVVHADVQPKIILFGGEACIRTDGDYPKLSDVYEGSPREPSGTLVWRALTGPPGETNNAEVVVGEADVVKPDGPVPMAFHAACAASVRDEEAIVVHGGMNQSSELLGDLWALFPRSRPGDTSHAHGDDNSETFSWERLHPEGEGPPPAAYHSATPVNCGKRVVFLGGRNWGSSIFLLDAVGLKWSSVDVSGFPERCLHTAISVTDITAESPTEDGHQQEQQQEDSSSVALDAPASQQEEAATAPSVQLWDPATFVNSRGGADESAGASEGLDQSGGGDGGDHHGGPSFENILIFGGIGASAVSGDATVLRVDGTVAPMPLARKAWTPPGPRYNHAMVSVQDGEKVFLFGGFRGDGTRLEEAFLLDLASPVGVADVRSDEEDKGDDIEDEAVQTDITVTFGDGDIYTGQLDEDGRRQGQGRCEYAGGGGGKAGGGSYSGSWDDDKPHGQGERFYPPEGALNDDDVTTAFGVGCPPVVSYRGGWKSGVRDGHGVCSFAAVASTGIGVPAAHGAVTAPARGVTAAVPYKYEGGWVDGRPFGRGTLILRAAAPPPPAFTASRSEGTRAGGGGDSGGSGGGGGSGGRGGSSIDGVWTKEGLVHGREQLPGKEGVYEGQYRLGRREGHGRLDLPDGSEYEGTWRNGRQNGIGTFRCGVTRHVYTGKWVGGARCGKGVCQYASGSRYEGLWLDGLRHGEGVFTSPAGDVQAGLWHRDECVTPAVAAHEERNGGPESLTSLARQEEAA